MNSPRVFEDIEAVRSEVPLLVGLVGPTFSGKTWTALELATGIQQVTGGEIFGIDTEKKRMMHYAERFRFRWVGFEAPFNPLAYLAAIEHCKRKGAKVVIIDSLSHMHEGPGGTLETHSAELDRIAGDDWKKRDRCTMLAWQKPKAELRRFLNSILQMDLNLIFCFRAKEKLKIERGKEPIEQGYMQISGDEVFYEMTCSLLFHPGAKGVPTLRSQYPGEQVVIKIPEQFNGLFREGEQVSREHGRKLAEWSTGGATPSKPAPVAPQAVNPYQAMIADLAAASGVTERSLHSHLLEVAIANGWAEKPELKDGKLTQRAVMAALELAYADYAKELRIEAENAAYPPDEPDQDEPGANG